MSVGPLTNAAAQALFKERYRDVVPALFEAGYEFCRLIEKKTDVEVVNNQKGLVIAKKLKPGGQVRTFEPDGGDLGRGTGAQYAKATLTPIPLLVALEATRATMWNTASDNIAIKNAIKDQLTDGTTEYKAQYDRYIFGDGTGVMATVASGGAGTTPVMTAPVGTRWLRQGHKYSVYDTTLAAKKDTVTVDSLTHPTRTANILVAAAGGAAAGDKYLPEGVTGANPVWFNGFRYHFSSATTGSWMGISRTNPQLNTIEVNAGGQLSQAHVRALRNRMRLFRGSQIFKSGDWRFVVNPAQLHAYEQIAWTLNFIPKGPKERSGVDVMYDPEAMTIDGVAVEVQDNQRPDTIDLTNLKNWYRVETVAFGLYTVQDISTFPVYGASGGLSATDITYLCGISQFGVDDPGAGGYISSLTVPAQYSEFV
jgi:hypothetical protein